MALASRASVIAKGRVVATESVMRSATMVVDIANRTTTLVQASASPPRGNFFRSASPITVSNNSPVGGNTTVLMIALIHSH